MIILPSRRFVEPTKELIVPGNRIQGYFKLDVIGPHYGKVRRSTGWFPNLVTDLGLDQIGNRLNNLQSVAVGTGTAAPSVNDTSLEAQIAKTSSGSSSQSVQSSEPYYGSNTRTWTFGEGVAAGNLTEVGVGPDATTVSTFSRALIVDGEGSPTTLTVQEDESLQVSYQIRVYPPLVDVEDEITIGGETYDYILRAADVTGGTWQPGIISMPGGLSSSTAANTVLASDIGAITSQPSGTNFNATSVVDHAYTNGNHYRDGTVTWGLSAGNVSGGIRSGRIGCRFGAFQIQFNPVLPKDNTKVLALTYRHAWARGSIE